MTGRVCASNPYFRLQHIGAETGVLTPVDVTESCGLDCQCANFGAFDDDEGTVTKCYRLAPELREPNKPL